MPHLCTRPAKPETHYTRSTTHCLYLDAARPRNLYFIAPSSSIVVVGALEPTRRQRAVYLPDINSASFHSFVLVLPPARRSTVLYCPSSEHYTYTTQYICRQYQVGPTPLVRWVETPLPTTSTICQLYLARSRNTWLPSGHGR